MSDKRVLRYAAVGATAAPDRVFDDYDEADEFAQAIGYPTLMGRAAR